MCHLLMRPASQVISPAMRSQRIIKGGRIAKIGSDFAVGEAMLTRREALLGLFAARS